jgi:hypothetical protein
MKQFTLTLLVLFILTGAASAQLQSKQAPGELAKVSANIENLSKLSPNELNTIDLSGKYSGQRHQFTADKKSFLQSFEYEFNIVQTGNLISGTSTIIKENGEYGDMKLRGMIVGDKLYFEEYEIVNQDKDPNMVWCFKSGALSIRKNSDNILKLTGITESFMSDSYLPCTGGTTDLSKVDNSNNFKIEEATAPATAPEAANDMNVFPNPFIEATRINYMLAANSTVTLEVYDLSGRKVSTLENNTAKNAGTYSVDFSAKNAGLSAGVFIAKLTVNGKVYSSEMVQMK